MIMNCSEFNFKIKTASCEEIINHLIRCADNFNPPLYTYVNIEEYSRKINNNAITFESWVGNNLVGLIAAYFNNYDTKAGYITNVSVIKEFQGYGIASKLLSNTIKYGKNNGFISVALEVNIKNSNAIKLYEKYGFIATEQSQEKIKMKSIILFDK